MQQPEILLDHRMLPVQGGTSVAMKHLRDDPAIWRILEARARELALEQTTTAAELGEELLIFRLGDGGYSLPARLVREVQSLTRWTPLPSTPPCVIGLVNVRGRLVVALDLRPLLDIAPAPAQPGACLLIVGTSAMEVGIVADVVVGIQQDDTALAPAFSTMAGHRVAWIRGIDRDLNLQLDAEALVADPRLLDI